MLLVTALVAVGQFSAFTFVSPILQSVAGVAESDLARVLLVYGVAGMAGNFLAGRFVGRSPRRGIQLIAATITVTLFVLLTVDVGPVSTTGLMVVWGLAFGASSVTLQLWLLQVSGRARAARHLGLRVGLQRRDGRWCRRRRGRDRRDRHREARLSSWPPSPSC